MDGEWGISKDLQEERDHRSVCRASTWHFLGCSSLTTRSLESDIETGLSER